PKASLLGLPAARLSGTKTIYTIHGALYFRDNTTLGNLAGWMFEKWCCAWAHRVLVQSREDEEVLSRARICRARKIDYVGNGVVLEHFSKPSRVSAPGRPSVLMISRLVREKGCSDFIELARALSGKAEFVHVGPIEPDQRDGLSSREIETSSRFVNFVGAVKDVRPYLSASSVVVLPSYREGIPRVAMEAAASAKPVVAYDVRGVREVVDPASGLLVRRGDSVALTRVVESLLADPERRTRLGAECRERVVRLFSEDLVVERLRRVYDELCPPGTSQAPSKAAARR
ncbi:MAG: glycosyltransferase, partial [Acidimicrobiales bacterium]